jgi:hypothetical protein
MPVDNIVRLAPVSEPGGAPPPVIVTHRILAETGDILNTESGNKLRTEQNNP